MQEAVVEVLLVALQTEWELVVQVVVAQGVLVLITLCQEH
jgi:hypothetical protein